MADRERREAPSPARPLGADLARSAVARDLPADRQFLSCDRRAGRVAAIIGRILPISLSPASVRNVMADLEQLGLIYAPHTSRRPPAHRIRPAVLRRCAPRDRRPLRPKSASRSRRRSVPATPGRTVESVLAEASQALSGLLGAQAGVVLATQGDVRLKHIEFVRIEPTRALVVLVGEDGSVENRLVALDPGTTPSSADRSRELPQRASARPHARRRARGLEAARGGARAELDRLTEKLVDAGLASWAGPATDGRRR